MTIRTPLIGFFFLLFAFFALPQTQAASLALQDILSTVRQPATLSAQFQLTKKTLSLSSSLNSRGRLLLDRKRGLLWITTTPFEDVLGFSATKSGALDENSHWKVTSQKSITQVTDFFEKIQTGQIEELQRLFFLTLTGTKTHWQVLASPRSNTISSRLVEILFSGSTHIDRIQIVETNGSITNIVFHNICENPIISASDDQFLDSLK